MANFEKQFQHEISRLARKALKAEVERLRKEHGDLRRAVLELRRQVSALKTTPAKTTPAEPQTTPDSNAPIETTRITGQNIRQLRQRLKITQAELARLTGVTSQSVYQWERQKGPLTLRKSTREALLAVKRLSIREARTRLSQPG